MSFNLSAKAIIRKLESYLQIIEAIVSLPEPFNPVTAMTFCMTSFLIHIFIYYMLKYHKSKAV